jgi:FkbM family methyltransferase
MGSKRVKLPRNNKKYWKAIKTAKKLKKLDEKHDPNFMPYVLEKFDLSLIGYDLRLYFSDVGIAIDFIIEQYAYKNGKTIIEANKGDVVLDIGGYWGDTALYFAHKVGNDGKVFSFEFIPDNLKLHEINTDLNQTLKKRIEVINHPVSDKTEDTIYYKDDGPGSRIQDKPFLGQTGSTTTITIDDFVQQNNLDRVDFIKMDIEGAENLALKGAIQTIKKYRPKLAIAIYHSIDDLINIPKWVLELNLDYEIFIDHYTIHQEETILFARPKND